MKYAASLTALLACAVTMRVNAQPVPLSPANMNHLGAVDERFQSYNVEMMEITGGRFWKPYTEAQKKAALAAAPAPLRPPSAGLSPDLYESRPPIDLTSPRLRQPAAALGPVHVRVSGTWANAVYFHGSDAPVR